MKRAFDIIVSIGLLLLLLPALIVIGLAVRIASPGPALFRQTRVGRFGRRFTLLKFRSMLFENSRSGPHYTEIDDLRVTPLGRFLRKTSIDELPQLWNVLTGSMSLVGPRPDVPEQENDYTPRQWHLRHMVRPGITGLAQAVLRGDASKRGRIALDLKYVRNPTLCTDLKIVCLTIREVIRARTT